MNRIPTPRESYSAEIRIDIETLRQFGTFIRNELNALLVPTLTRAHEALAANSDVGLHFPTDEFQAMNLRHANCVRTMAQQLAALETGLAILADSADTIANRYSSSDALAHTKIQNIAPAINTATLRETQHRESA